MRTPLQINKNSVWQLQKALKDDYDQKVKLKIRALLLIAKGKLVTQASDALAIEQRTVRNWVHQFLKEGLAGIKDHRTAGRVARMTAEQMKLLKERIEQGPLPQDKICSLRGQDIRRIIHQEFGLEYSLDGVYYLLRYGLGMSYVKPRPHHYKADKAAQESFKKTSHRCWQSINSSIPAKK